MTNEEAKQEAIKNAYGDKWDLVKKLTPKNGNDDHDLIYNGYFKLSFLKLNMGSHLDFFPTDKFIYNGSGFENGYVIPTKIHGLHQNNGWIRIEPDGSNLIKTSGEKFKVLLEDGSIEENDINYSLLEIHKLWKITHYKPITPELKPIY